VEEQEQFLASTSFDLQWDVQSQIRPYFIYMSKNYGLEIF